jgi:tetratricopeptide (TPR) repeat protein
MRATLTLALALAVVTAAPARGEALDDRAEREARAHYTVAKRQYTLGAFDRAIAGFKRAYELSPAAGLLFNIAQAYRAKGDHRHALHFYEAYLREDPDAPERAFVDARISELRALAAANPGPALDREAAGLRTAGAVTAGVGAVLVVTGLVFAIQAHGAFDGVAGGDDPARGKSAQTRAIVLTAGGAVAMLTGGVMFHAGTQKVQVTPTLGDGAAGLQVSGTF